jgi:hypothetical protein
LLNNNFIGADFESLRLCFFVAVCAAFFLGGWRQSRQKITF